MGTLSFPRRPPYGRRWHLRIIQRALPRFWARYGRQHRRFNHGRLPCRPQRTDRVAKIKDFANWYDQQMADLEAATEAIKADPRHGSLTFSVVGGGDKESWVTQNASEARYYASNLWRKQMIRYQELNVSHTSRLETCPVLGTRLLFICICQGLRLLFVGGNGASSCANPPGVPEF